MANFKNIADYKKYLATLSRQELFEAYNGVDRQKHHDRLTLLRQEISTRKVDKRPEAPAELPDLADRIEIGEQCLTGQEMELSFNGSTRDYFRIWIVNLCLTLLTFGIFSAWAKVRKKRFFYSHLSLDDTPFQYLAKPVPILKGRLIAGVAFLIFYITSHFFIAQLPYVLAAGLVLAPWVMVQSAAFNARYSAFRNISFQFNGTYLEAFRVISAWGIVPALVIGFIFDWWGQVWIPATLLLAGSFLFPWWLRNIKNFMISQTSYGQVPGSFFARGGDFFSIYFRSGLIMMGVGILVGGITATVIALTDKNNFEYITYAIMIPTYAGYILAFAFIQARMTNTVWNNIRIGPIRFHCTLASMDLVKLYLSNAIGIIFSAGLLIPWAVVRTIKYRTDKTRITNDKSLTLFKGTPATTVAATGSELGEFFDMDLAI